MQKYSRVTYSLHVYSSGRTKRIRTLNQKSVQTPTSAFHRFLKTLTQEIWRDGFEVLEDAHSVGVAENLVRLFVVAKADVGGGDEQIERIVLVHVQIPVLGFFLRRKIITVNELRTRAKRKSGGKRKRRSGGKRKGRSVGKGE